MRHRAAFKYLSDTPRQGASGHSHASNVQPGSSTRYRAGHVHQKSEAAGIPVKRAVAIAAMQPTMISLVSSELPGFAELWRGTPFAFQLPLINDDPRFPVPGLPGNAKSNAKVLATILTIESVRLVLPKIRALTPEQLREFRSETAELVKPFRLAMLRMAKDLNAAITSEMTLNEVREHAKFLVETPVYPELKELEKIVHDPEKPWYRRAVDLARSAPEVITSFSAMPKNLALAMLLGRIAGVLADATDEQRDKEHKLGRTGLHFLLQLKQH
jgi:hypothetical protein